MQTINDVTRAGGQALMVWEVVSSVTCPEIVAAELSDLPNVLHTALNSRNFFTGLNPAKVLESFRAVKGASCKVQVHAPWKWDFLDRVYAVTAISFRVE
jgi:hypothetical protein